MIEIKLNLEVFNCFESYQLNSSLIIDIILEAFCNEFDEWWYIKFSKLDKHIKQGPKKALRAKKIYKNKFGSYVNQCLDNLITNKQLLAKNPTIFAIVK